MEVLLTENITKIYGGKNGISTTNALNGINFAVEEGEFVGLMGPSGSGKTTLLNIVCGLTKASEGKVYINGEDIETFNKNKMALFRREKLGMISQEYNLLEGLTLEENVALPLMLNKVKEEKIKNIVEDIMRIMGIYEIKGKYPYSVSGGQLQRTAACRALITNPSLLLCDEPTGNLDSKAATRFMKYLELINTKHKATILMATHDSFAASFSKRIIFIKDGRIFTEIQRKEGQREFFSRILDCLAVLGGEANEF